jgi:PTS system nitrogen regulatory IIA component
MKLIDLFPQQQMKATLSSTDMVSTFAELLQVIGSIYSALPADEQDDLCDRLVAREKLATTVLAEGIAIPHIYHDRFRHLVGAFGRCREGVRFLPDGPLVRGVFLIIVPVGRNDLQMMALNKITGLLQRPDFWRRVMGCSDGDELYDLFVEVDSGAGRDH